MRSFRYMIMETGVRLTGYKKVFSLDAQGLNAYIEKRRGKRKTAPPRFIYKRHQIREMTVCGRPCYIVAPKGGRASEKKAALFLHGGGMFMEALPLHWMVVSKLVMPSLRYSLTHIPGNQVKGRFLPEPYILLTIK